MKKFSALSKKLLSLPGVARDNMDSFIDLGKLNPTGRDRGTGFEIGRFKYDAVISIERFPAKLAEMLLSVLLIWISENDPERDELGLSEPDIDITPEDEGSVTVEISIEFDEALTIIRDSSGSIEYDGALWSVGDIEINVAENLYGIET